MEKWISPELAPRPDRPALARIVVIGTGGTIAGEAGDAAQTTGYASGAVSIGKLLEAVPALRRVADIEAVQLAALDSKDMDHATWVALSHCVQRHLDRPEVDGVVVTHGTDTLEETAYWLQLTLATVKPVVMTAAMRPATALSADGPMNLLDAVTLAASPSAAGKGVLVAFGHRIFSARDIAKTSSYALDAFSGGEAGVLGWVQDGRVDALRHVDRLHTGNSVFAPLSGTWDASKLARVELVISHAGVSPLAVEAALRAGVDGIVVAGTGNGSIHQTLLQILSRAVQDGVVVVRSSRIGHCRVTTDPTEDIFIASGTLGAWKARILLMLSLTRSKGDWQACREAFAQY